jgi:tRNA threonylcarbamoyl adenosine modification protein YeaZ
LAARHEELAKGQAERLMPMIDEVLSEAGATYADLAAIGVGVGPGNFTGIRISVSAARGLALALEIPAVGVSLLEALAFGHDGPVLASISAGRDQLYLQRFALDADRGPEVSSLDAVSDWHQPNLTCIGNKEHQIAEILGAQSGPAPYYPASAIARIAAQRAGLVTTPPAPLYLRAADAAPARDAGPTILP